MYNTYTEEFDLIVDDVTEGHKKLHNKTNEDVKILNIVI